MSWTMFAFTFINAWWITLFAVLPWGVQCEENPEALHASGAPKKAMMIKKALVTTVIALALTFAIKWVVEAGIIPVRPE